MSSELGRALRLSVFGQSHGKAIGGVIDGLPAGERIDMEALFAFMDRRRPGKALSTQRNEADVPEFLSGLQEDVTCGFPLAFAIKNADTRSGDYAPFATKPRPGHADYTAFLRYGGFADMRGGGHFSGRLTAPLCIAGGIAKQLLEKRGIFVGAHLFAVGGAKDEGFDPVLLTQEALLAPGKKEFPVCDDARGLAMKAEAEAAKSAQDSVGGVVECAVLGFPAGVGSPMFDGVENRLAAALFGIPAVKGLEFGAGFGAAGLRGSENNDPFVLKEGKVCTETNCHGGILGGITTGMPVVFRLAFKPTPSIAQKQRTVDLAEGVETTIEIKGRHDPCVALRAVPVVEAVAAFALLDLYLEEGRWN